MTTSDFLSQLNNLGVRLSVEGNQLRLNAPQGVVTPELKAQIVAHKEKLIALLSQASNAAVELPPITPVTDIGPFPLSVSQERLWSLSQLLPDSPIYNMYLAFELKGPLNFAALEHSFSEVIRRHNILRTNFQAVQGRPVQVVEPGSDWTFNLTNLSHVPNQDRRVDRFINQEIRRPFNVAQERLIRVNLLQLGPEHHILVLVMHHIISDGWSWDVLLHELETLYDICQADGIVNLPEPAIQFADYAVWQQNLFKLGQLDEQLTYWQRQLNQVEALLLPADTDAVAWDDFDGDREELSLSAELTAQLKNFSRTSGHTLFITLLAGFYALLHQISNQQDLIVGTPVACRHQPETKNLIGYLNNLIILRLKLSDEITFTDLVQQVKQMVLAGFKHQDVPIHKLIELPQFSRAPLTRAIFSLQENMGRTLNLANLTSINRLNVYNHMANFDLFLTVENHEEQLTAIVEYKRSLFKATTIRHFLSDYHKLLEILTLTPNQPLNLAAISDLIIKEVGAKDTLYPYVPPRNQLEAQLTKIWEDVLGQRNISIETNFFELGGSSLQAVQLMSQLQQQVEPNLPMATLFEAPTIAQLARRLNNDQLLGTWSCLVPIQPSGTKAPLFLVHHGGGSLFGYAQLARHMDAEQPLYGLQEPGWDNPKQTLPQSVEGMAAQYLAEMRSVQPDGPYYLGGFCFGGVVAYEMAQQLKQAGKQVAFLSIIDALSPNFPTERPALEERLQRHTSRMASMSYSKKMLYLMQRVKRRGVWEVQKRYYQVRDQTRLATVQLCTRFGWPVPNPAWWQHVLEWNGGLLQNYSIKPYQGYTLLIRSQNPDLEADYGWRELVNDNLAICMMPTEDHLDMLIEPHVQQLATFLQAHLNNHKQGES